MAEFRAPVSLILLAQAGDRRALEELFKGIQQPLYEYLVRLVGDAHGAEDVVQEVLVLLWRKLPWLRDPLLFRPWVYRIASREGFRRLRRERFWSRLRGPAALELVAGDTSEDWQCLEWREELAERLATVPPASRAVLVLHYQQGLTLEEVAAALELPVGTIKSRLAYGLTTLREKLGRCERGRE